jgi:phosphopantothenoylcysteine decarboxylase/phosphopantothenate--cysteine ligase
LAGIKTIHVETAEQMMAAVDAALPADIAVCAAAVSDWRAAHTAPGKLKKGMSKATLELEETQDILASLSRDGNRRPRLVVGFAAETEHLLKQASAKLLKKNCDWLLANDVAEGKVFGSDENQVLFLRRMADGSVNDEAWPLLSKDQVARQLVDKIIDDFAH